MFHIETNDGRRFEVDTPLVVRHQDCFVFYALDQGRRRTVCTIALARLSRAFQQVPNPDGSKRWSSACRDLGQALPVGPASTPGPRRR